MREFILRAFTDDESEVCKRVGLEEVVRCKDCRYAPHTDINDYWCDKFEKVFCSNWFCADGKRREGSE